MPQVSSLLPGDVRYLITVKDVLARPLFKKFRLVSGQRGLSNHVASAGFWEWETGAEIEFSFPKNEFVVTTLTAAKDDLLMLEESLTRLIHCKVAAIAIKNVHFKELPGVIYELSDQYNIPILTFENLYVDEVLFDLKTAIRENDAKYQRKIVNRLLSDAKDSAEKRRNLALQLNPAFGPHLVFCAFISPVHGEEAASAQEEEAKQSPAVAAMRNSFRQNIRLENFKYSLLPYNEGLLCICTVDEPVGFSKLQAQYFLELCFSSDQRSHIGISLQNSELCMTAQGLQEAVYANMSCRIDHVSCLEFSETGIDRFLWQSGSLPWARNYFSERLEKIQASGDAPEIMLQTLITYVECAGNVGLTAQNMHQHSNTVRYRLSRIKEAWNTHNDIDFDAQAYMFTKLYYFYRL